MKKVSLIIVAMFGVLALTACDTEDVEVVVDAVQQVLPDLGTVDLDQAQSTPTVNPPIYLYPGGEGMCNGLHSETPLPCHRVIDVCVEHADGYLSSKWIPELVRCTPEYPTWRTVCKYAPAEEWFFYGYTEEECAAA